MTALATVPSSCMHGSTESLAEREVPDAELLQRYASGDRKALSQLFQRHADVAFRVALRCTANEADAEDAVQTAFLNLIARDAASKFREFSSVKGWLMSIVINACRTQTRKEAGLKRRETAVATQAEKDRAPCPDERVELVMAQVKQMPEEYRMPIWLHYLEKLTFREVGESLGLSEDAAEKRVSRGLDMLRDTLATGGLSAAVLPGLLTSIPLETAPAALKTALGASTQAGLVAAPQAAAAAGHTAAASLKAGVVFKISAAVVLAGSAVVSAVVIANKTESPEPPARAEAIDGEKPPAGNTKPETKLDAKDLLGSLEFKPSPEHPVGFRGDTSGRYPGASLPMEWGRWPKGPMKSMRSQAKKPSGEQPGGQSVESFAMGLLFRGMGPSPATDIRAPEDIKRPSELGGVKEWLTAGPFASKDAAKAIEESQLPDEATVEPDEGAKAGENTWQRGYFNCVKASKEGDAIYTHTYLYCEDAGKTDIGFQTAGGIKAWINGEVFFNTKDRGNGLENFGYGGRATLKKGWNRLLLKLVAGDQGIRLDFRFRPVTMQCETKNILWTSKMPNLVQVDRNAGSPIVVGDKIFCVAEPADLICVDAKTGKILWIRPNTFYDTISDKDKAELPVSKLSFVKARGKTFAINSSRPLDQASIENVSAYQADGIQVEKAELGNKGRTLRLTVKEAIKDGQDSTLKITGLKTADGFPVNATIKFVFRQQYPVTGEPLREVLLSQAFGDIDAMRKSNYAVEKSLVNPTPGDKWKVVFEEDGKFDFTVINGNPGGGFIYTHSYVHAESDCTAQLKCDRAGLEARVIVNGAPAKVIQAATEMGVRADKEILDIALKKGWNSILIGNCSHDGLALWGLRVSIIPGANASLTYTADNPENATGAVNWEEVAPPATAVDDFAQFNSIKALADQRKTLNDEIIKELNEHVSPEGYSQEKELEAIDAKLKAKRDLDTRIVQSMARIDRKFNPRTQTWGNCSATPCSDGERVYVWYHFGVAAAYDLDGNLQWSDQHCLHGGAYYKHGDHNSPILTKGMFIVCQTHNDTAYDCKTGKVIWRVDGENPSFCSPVLGKVGNDDVIINWNIKCGSSNDMGIYRISDGSTVWKGRIPGVGEAHGTAGTPVVVGDRLINYEESGIFDLQIPEKPGTPFKTVARIKGNLWNDVVISPVYHDGLVYGLDYFATALYAYDLEKHEVAYKAYPNYFTRDGSRYWVPAPSPILAGKYLYFFDNSGTTVVVEPGRTYKEVGRNRILNFMRRGVPEQTATSPVAVGNHLIIRSCENMYCVGEK